MLGRDEAERAQASTAWSWVTAGNLDFGLEIYVDQLAVFMMLIVSGVGALIVGYSIGYMDKVDEERRFFAYMAFFVFSMLLLVEGGNLLMLLAAWGLVGLSSYLLIGFEHERPAADRRREEGVHHERGRRRDVRARALPPHPADGRPRVRGRLRGGRRAELDHGDARRARPARRRGREVGAAAAPDVAPGRDGGPHAGVRAHPRGDDGRRRRLPHLPHGARVRGGPGGAGHGRHPRRADARRRRA